jgi:Domain of unknown function (DUF4267)
MTSSSAQAQGRAATALSPWRSVGIWMSAILIGYILFNALRSTLDPVSFAAYYGLPLGGDDTNAFVFVYAIRALFLGLFGLALVVSRSYRALALFALVGAVMPIGDAILVAATGGGTGTVIRHSLTAVFLLLTGYFVQRWARRAAATQTD